MKALWKAYISSHPKSWNNRHGWIDGLGWCPRTSSFFFSPKLAGFFAQCIGTLWKISGCISLSRCILRVDQILMNSHRSCRPTSPTFTFAGAISRHASLQATWTKYDQINDDWSLKTQRCLVWNSFLKWGVSRMWAFFFIRYIYMSMYISKLKEMLYMQI